MENLNFKPGIKKITPDNFQMSRHGADILNMILKSLNSRLVNFCLQMEISVTSARQAVESLLTGDLRVLALAETDRVLMLHTNGLLKYEAKLPKTQIHYRKKGKKAKIIAAQELSEGISALTSLTFNDHAFLQDESKGIMCELLEDLAVKISDLVQSKVKDTITQNDITNVIENLLPEELARHAIAEGARMLFLYQNGVLESRSKSVAKTEVPKKARKRKRSKSVEITSMTKRRKKPTARKSSLKKAPKRTSRSKKRTKSKLTERRSRKRSSSRTKPLKKSSSRKRKPSRSDTKSKRTEKSKISRKKSVSSSRRNKSITRKSPRKVSTKTLRKISKKQPMEKKTVSKKETTREISTTVKTEIKSGTKKLNKSYKQELSTEGEKIIAECLYNLLNDLSDEMRKGKSSSIGPLDVRRAVMKIFPSELADLMTAEMSRVLMT